MKKKEFIFHKAAVDVTTGYGTDSFFKGNHQDPWDRDCFETLVDTAINHHSFHYPLPSILSLSAELPKSFTLLKQAGILTPISNTVADQMNVSHNRLLTEFSNFNKWVEKDPKGLKKWIAYHHRKKLKRQHKQALPKDVQECTADFWKHNKEAMSLSMLIGVSPIQLRYAFDVTFRGLQYYEILSTADCAYFPHPLRKCLLDGQESSSHIFSKEWSWGRFIANLMSSNCISSHPEDVFKIVVDLKSEVSLKRATWYDLSENNPKNKKEKIISVAVERGFPSKLRDSVHKWIERSLIVSVFGSEHYLGLPPIVSVFLTVGHFTSTFWKGGVSGKVGRLPFCRGLLVWPGLFPDETK